MQTESAGMQEKGKTLECVVKFERIIVESVKLEAAQFLETDMEENTEKVPSFPDNFQFMQPDAKVVLGANFHVTAEKSAKSTIYNNQRINELNFEIQKIGNELGCRYINVNEIFDDARGNLSKYME